MNLVSFALRRPVSLVIAVVAIVLGALLALDRMPRDIFPDLGVPTIYVAQTYGGIDPAQMEGFFVNYYEYHFLYISGIEHIESKSIQGIGLIKLQFHPGTNMAEAMAETVSYVDRSRAFMPPGTLPPFVLRFDAGSVPVGDLVFSSKTRSIGELQDAALFRVRPLFATLPGVSAPPPFGSSERTIVINADPERLRAYNMSPEELVRALGTGNTITPSGNVPIGNLWPMVPANTVVSNIKELNDVPIRLEGPKSVFLRDVATVADATDIQTSYALVDGRRTVYIPVTKRADASTLAVVALVRESLSRFQAVLPDDIRVSYEFDQSPYVTRAIYGLLFEGGLGAVLTGLMVLLFLRDWRSALIVVLNIPLAILGASLALWVSGQTVNIMTLGGLALAVGILVDEATVTIENVHTHLARDRSIASAARDATAETTLPRFLAMVCILAVFIPALFMTGAARNLFVPLSLAVGFSMVGSFLLSSTLVPVLCVWFLRAEPRHESPPAGQDEAATLPQGRDEPPPVVAAGEVRITREFVFGRLCRRFARLAPVLAGRRRAVIDDEATTTGEVPTPGEPAFERLRRRYAGVASAVVAWRLVVVISYLAICGLLVVIIGVVLGTEIFPVVDTGQFELRLRAPPGTRIERTEQIALRVLESIKREVGPDNLAISLGFVGTQPPNFAINTIYLWSSGSEEAILQIQLKREAGIRVEELKEKLRRKLPEEFPGVRFSFEPSDIVSRVMSFGAPTPIEVAVSGTDMAEIRRYAEKLKQVLAKVPILRDQAFEQELEYPIIKVDLIRELAAMLGLTAEDMAHALGPATSSSRYTLPNYWADPKTGIGYQVQVEIPGPRMSSLEEVKMVPLAHRDGKHIAVRDVAKVYTETALGEYDRYNMQRMLTLSANIAGEDLGGAATRVRQAIAAAGQPPKAVTVAVRGQVRPMEEMFKGLQWGLMAAIGAILLLLTAYFQSFRLSTAVVLTIPAVVAGAAAMLWLTHTTLNIQSFMGTIMAVGVAVANSILLVTFAERSRLEGLEAPAAAVAGASSRLRPILMTGAAMIAGMIPMALGLSEGGEQTAPLARAVIGGLSGAMIATLLVLPAIFAMLTSRSSRASASLDPGDPESAHFESSEVPPRAGGGRQEPEAVAPPVADAPSAPAVAAGIPLGEGEQAPEAPEALGPPAPEAPVAPVEAGIPPDGGEPGEPAAPLAPEQPPASTEAWLPPPSSEPGAPEAVGPPAPEPPPSPVPARLPPARGEPEASAAVGPLAPEPPPPPMQAWFPSPPGAPEAPEAFVGPPVAPEEPPAPVETWVPPPGAPEAPEAFVGPPVTPEQPPAPVESRVLPPREPEAPEAFVGPPAAPEEPPVPVETWVAPPGAPEAPEAFVGPPAAPEELPAPAEAWLPPPGGEPEAPEAAVPPVLEEPSAPIVEARMPSAGGEPGEPEAAAPFLPEEQSSPAVETEISPAGGEQGEPEEPLLPGLIDEGRDVRAGESDHGSESGRRSEHRDRDDTE